MLPSRADLASKRTADPISPVDTVVDLTPTESLTANVKDDDSDDADADEALAAQSEDQAEDKDDDQDDELGEEAVDVHAIEAIETDAGSLDGEGLADEVSSVDDVLGDAVLLDDLDLVDDELEPPSAPTDLFAADTREAQDAAAAAPSDESAEDDQAQDQAPVLVFPESLAAGPGLTAFVPGQDAEAEQEDEQEAEQEDEEVSHSDEGDEPPYLMPPDVVEPRSWAGRGAVPLVGVALVVVAVGYFVFLGLGSVEGPTDQVLGEQDAADVASLEFSEELVDGGQPGRVDDVDDPVVGAGAPPARPAPSPAPPAAADPRPVPVPQPSPTPPPASVSAASASSSSSASAAAPVSGSGWILVRTEPPGAVVTVDGEGRGTTPLSLQDVAYGEHEVAVGLLGFGSLSRTVTISPTETIATVGVTLTPERDLAPQPDAVETALLEVESRPSGARVLLDGGLVGNTPMRLNVPIGRYQVRIEVDGYQAWSKAVAVTDDDEGNRVAASLDRTR